MTSKSTLKPVAAIVGAALVGSLASMNVSAADNPFGASQLDSGYMTLAEGKCGGEEKPAADAKSAAEAKCGGKTEEKMEKEGKCGDEPKMEKEGKCGEGKCGTSK